MDLEKLYKRSQEMVSELMHSNVKQDDIEMIVLESLAIETLKELNIKENEQLKKAIMYFYFFGQITGK